MAKDNSQETAIPKSKVVSVKLDSTQQTKLGQRAAQNGTTVSEELRKLLDETTAETVAVLPPVAAGTPTPIVVNLSNESLQILGANFAKILQEAQPQTIEVSTPIEPSFEREYLRKICGLQPESENTLAVEEEEYLTNLKAGIEADLRETFLTKEKSVLYPLSENKLQLEMFEKMLERRETTATEKTQTLTQVFQSAIAKVFFEDAKSLYNSNLFKATYGFDYNEFKAVFQL